jgi:hypothetical protein
VNRRNILQERLSVTPLSKIKEYLFTHDEDLVFFFGSTKALLLSAKNVSFLTALGRGC